MRPGHVAAVSREPLLLVVDDSWAAAKDWDKRQDRHRRDLSPAPQRADATGGGRHDGPRSAARRPRTAPTPPSVRSQSRGTRAARRSTPTAPHLLARLQRRYAAARACTSSGSATASTTAAAVAFAEGLAASPVARPASKSSCPSPRTLPLALAQPRHRRRAHQDHGPARRRATRRKRRSRAVAANGRELGASAA